MKISITAGYDNSIPAILIADNLLNLGHEIVSVLVVSPYSLSRVKRLIKSKGFVGFKSSVKKLLRSKIVTSKDSNAIEDLVKQKALIDRSLKKWCANKNVKYVKLKSVNDKIAIKTINETNTDVLVYVGGGILKSPIINAVKGYVINMHSGPLPEIRGMNAIEWATLLGERLNVTIHFIDEGIDTGKIIDEFPVSTDNINSIDQLRDQAIVTGINGLTQILKTVKTKLEIQGHEDQKSRLFRQCYVLSPALKDILEKKISIF